MSRRKFSLSRTILRVTAWVMRSMAWIVLAAVLAVVAGILGLKSMLTPEVLRRRITEKLESTFRRPVRIGHVTFLVHQGIKVSGLEVAEAEDFPGEVFLSSEFLLAKYRFRALLRGRLELDEVLLMSPRIRLVRRKDGVWNLAHALQRPDSPPRKGLAGFKLQPLTSADILRIERGTVEVEDQIRGTALVLRDLSLDVREFNWESPFSFDLGFAGEAGFGGRRLAFKAALDGEAALEGLRPGAGRLTASRLRLDVDGQPFELSGELTGFDKPSVRLQASTPRFDSADLARLGAVPAGIHVPAAKLSVRLQLPAVSTRPAPGSMDWRLEKLALSAEGLSASASGRVDPASRSIRLRWDAPRTAIERVTALYEPWAQRKVSGNVTLSGLLGGTLEKPVLEELKLKAEGLSVESGRGKRLSNAELHLEGTEGLRKLDVRLLRGTYVAYGNALSDLNVDLRLAGGNVLLRKVDLTWNDSRFRLRGCVEDLSDVDHIYVDGEVDSLRFDETYQGIFNLIAQRKAEKGEGPDPRPWSQVFKYAIPEKLPNLTGRLKVGRLYSPNFESQGVDIRWDLRDIARGLESVSGSFRVGFGPAVVNNAHEVRKQDPILNVLILPFSFMQEMEAKARASFDTATLKTLAINRTYGDFSVQQGLVDVRYVHFDSPQFVAFAEGRVDFPREKLDLNVLMRAAKPRGQLPFTMMDTEGRPALALLIKGDLNLPNVELSHRKMGPGDIEDALAASTKRAVPMAELEGRLSCGVKP